MCVCVLQTTDKEQRGKGIVMQLFVLSSRLWSLSLFHKTEQWRLMTFSGIACLSRPASAADAAPETKFRETVSYADGIFFCNFVYYGEKTPRRSFE